MIEPTQVEALLDEALPKSPAERAAFLDHACEGNRELRQEVERLLAVHPHAEGFLGRPALHDTAAYGPLREASGTVIDEYKLLEQIGEGGMGTVWMAQQTEPVKRLVALKLIKAGMDSKQVIARFEAERQALALMDHANIARVLDAGTTSTGRPYFVMDLVKGVPITKYCDEHHLTPRQRLELFLPVCQAVQHAHQKGIIHRDLKPSNMLVALYDGKPVPKVIDFGVAKAAGQSLTDKTLVTGFGNIVGTLEYMSPEQAEINQLDIDTRSDIYALGVLLYELLTGSPPFTRKELTQAGLLEMLRVIREQEPSKPSTKLSTADGLPTLAANRGTEPAKLTKLVRGELDWIVMKALEKDRNRRYQTANSFAMDVQRYLADEPVLACPPSPGYRLRKLARRNKRALATAVLLSVMVLAVAAVLGWAARDRAARQAALEQEVTQALEEVRNFFNRDKLTEARSALKRAQGLMASGAAHKQMRERITQWRADFAMVDQLDEIALIRAMARQGPLAEALGEPAYRGAFRRYGLKVEALDPDQAAELIKTANIRARLVAGLDDWVLSTSAGGFREVDRVLAVLDRADPDPWRGRFRKAFLRRNKNELAALSQDKEALAQPAVTLHLLGVGLSEAGQIHPAVKVLARAQQRHPADFWINYDLAHNLTRLDPPQPGEAVGFFRVAVAMRAESPLVHASLGVALWQHGQLAGAERELREAIRLEPAFARAHLNLGVVLREQGRLDDAEAEYREAIRLRPTYALAHNHLGRALASRGQPAAGAAAFQEAIRLQPNSAPARVNLGNLFLDQDKFAEAEINYREAIRREPNDPEAYMNLGTLLRRQGKPSEAAAEYREAIRRHPEHAVAHNLLGNLLFDEGKWAEAADAYRRAIHLKPDDAGYHNNLGRALHLQGDQEGAAVAHREAIRLKPNFAEAFYSLGRVYSHEGKVAKAEAAYREAIRLKPGYAEAHTNLGNRLLDQGKLPQAEAEYRKGIDLKPELAEAHNGLGSLLLRQGKVDGAVAEFREAIRLRPGRAAAHYNLGIVLFKHVKLADAEAEYLQAIRLKPDYAEAFVNLGNCLQRQGKRTDAEAAYRDAIHHRPSLAVAHYNLGSSLSERGRLADAAVEHRETIKLKPDYAEAHVNLGSVLLRQGKRTDAEAAYREAIRRQPSLAVAHYNLGNLLPDECKLAEYREAVRLKPNYAAAHSNLAWLLATCPDPKLRDPQRAVEHAQKAVALDSQNAIHWGNLAVAHYRAGLWREAVMALEKVKAMQKVASVSSSFFLAMAYWKLDRKDEARRTFDQAAERMDKLASPSENQRRFRTEAEEVLEIKKK
jgi:tetratricopeptide (TPR) repeat protein/serine/threonine protein kinase